MIRTLIFLSSLLLLNPLMGQELSKDQFEGFIIKSNGKEVPGIVKISESHLPWSFQETIRFIETDDVGKTLSKKKIKFEKYKPKDIDGFSINGVVYRSVIYSDYGGIGNASDQNTVNKAAAVIGGLSKNKHFMEEYRSGVISVYKYYSAPAGFSVTAGDEDKESHREFVESAKRNYDVVIHKEKAKAKPFNDMNISKYFSDCDLVVEKFKKKEYTRKPVKGLGSLMKSGFLFGDALRNAAYEIIDDYEANCAK